MPQPYKLGYWIAKSLRIIWVEMKNPVNRQFYLQSRIATRFFQISADEKWNFAMGHVARFENFRAIKSLWENSLEFLSLSIIIYYFSLDNLFNNVVLILTRRSSRTIDILSEKWPKRHLFQSSSTGNNLDEFSGDDGLSSTVES